MVTPVAQSAPAAFPGFDEQAGAIMQLPATPADQVLRTPQTPPRLVRFVPAGLLERAPGIEPPPAAAAVPATPQGQIIGPRNNPPALPEYERHMSRGPLTPPHQITRGNPTEPPPRKSSREFAPQILSARA